MCHGWKIVGDLDYCGEGTKDLVDEPEEKLSTVELWKLRQTTNASVISSLSESECEQDVMNTMWNDAELGAMPTPVVATEALEDTAVSILFGVQ